MAFNANRLKVLLKLSINRLQLLQAKKSSLNAATRKELAALLERGKEESARIRVRRTFGHFAIWDEIWKTQRFSV